MYGTSFRKLLLATKRYIILFPKKSQNRAHFRLVLLFLHWFYIRVLVLRVVVASAISPRSSISIIWIIAASGRQKFVCSPRIAASVRRPILTPPLGIGDLGRPLRLYLLLQIIIIVGTLGAILILFALRSFVNLSGKFLISPIDKQLHEYQVCEDEPVIENSIGAYDVAPCSPLDVGLQKIIADA